MRRGGRGQRIRTTGRIALEHGGLRAAASGDGDGRQRGSRARQRAEETPPRLDSVDGHARWRRRESPSHGQREHDESTSHESASSWRLLRNQRHTMRRGRWCVAMTLAGWLAQGDETAEARDVHDSMCRQCKTGSVADGGVRTDPVLGCVQWCSRAGYCGDGSSYRRGLDCRRRNDESLQVLLAGARGRAMSERDRRYDPEFVRLYGGETWEQHERHWDHGERFGRIISVRGERHCGTGWVRIMVSTNCPEVRHYWTPSLDSDGLYGWKHDYVPESFDARSKDAIVIVFRSVVAWVPKMHHAAYSEPIQRLSRSSISAFVSRPFAERGVKYDHLLDLRAKKYAQYLRFLGSHANVLGARYEDLVLEPTFLFERLVADLAMPCIHDPAKFNYVRAYAKFGAVSANAKSATTANRTWTEKDWTAVVSRLDLEVERNLGYAYDLSLPGRWYHFPLPPLSPLLRPRDAGAGSSDAEMSTEPKARRRALRRFRH